MTKADVEKPNEDKSKGDTKKEKTEGKEQEMSEEDKHLQEELNMLVERLTEPNQALYRPALESLRTLIRSSTTSMTSVPKPLKFLRPHYETMKTVFEKIKEISTKKFCADVISVLGMTMGEGRDCLKYRLLGSHEPIESWGHEYVRHLTGEVAQEWQDLEAGKSTIVAKKEELEVLIKDIVPYLMSHNAEAEACDLLMEVEKIDHAINFVDENVYGRVCLYLKSCVQYVPEPENTTLLKTALAIYQKFNQAPDAMFCAIQLNDVGIMEDIFSSCTDPMMQKQLALILGKHHIFIEINDQLPEHEDHVEIMSNTHLSTNFLALARELDIMEPKVAEDIFKSHLDNTRPSLGANVDSARQNLAISFVNGFVNTAFGKDKLMFEEQSKWIFKNKEQGMMSTTATLGLILLWDVDGGLTQIDKYLYSNEDYIKAGALLACGVVSAGVKNECDPALALLGDYMTNGKAIMRIGAILGLGLAYTGSKREDVITLLSQVYSDSASMELRCLVALSLGMVCVGSCNGDVTSSILQVILECAEEDLLNDTHSKFLALGLGLNYLGKQDDVEVVLASLQACPQPFQAMATTLVEACAYAGTGNVLKIQHFLHICSEHYDSKDAKKDEKAEDKKDDKKDKKETKDAKDSKTEPSKAADAKSNSKNETKNDLSSQQAMAVLGIGLVAMGEDIGVEMAFRSMGHLLRYGEPVIKRVVPLALALLYASNPKLSILDTLSKFSHDSDPEVSHNAILALGLVGAGTNNARLSQMLRQLAVYHSKDPNNLFLVRIAQGLVHLGKGTLTISPYHTDRQILSPVSLAGLLAFVTCCLDVKTFFLGKEHYLMFHLVTAFQPRMLVTMDSDLRPCSIPVRVGQAVDVVGQAGKPKTITGFQTHTTPVLLAYGERAELATEEYLSYSPILEGFVIVRKNPDYVQPEEDTKKK